MTTEPGGYNKPVGYHNHPGGYHSHSDHRKQPDGFLGQSDHRKQPDGSHSQNYHNLLDGYDHRHNYNPSDGYDHRHNYNPSDGYDHRHNYNPSDGYNHKYNYPDGYHNHHHHNDAPKRRFGMPSPAELADRLGVSVSAVVFGVLGVAAAAIAGWWALRPPASPDAETVLPSVASVSIPVPTTEVSPPPVILVHVAGAVSHPGVHELPVDSRVTDAIDAAGGLTDFADAERLNLAAPLSDGARLWVPAVGEVNDPEVVQVTPSGSDSGTGVASDTKVNINTADAATLQTLPGIGPSLAAAILEYRARVGSFARVEDLDNVTGIGPSKLAQIQPFARV